MRKYKKTLKEILHQVEQEKKSEKVILHYGIVVDGKLITRCK